MEALENVKVGDKLIVRTSYNECIETVERITATLVITKYHRFNKKRGEALGGDAWTHIWATPASTKDVERIKKVIKRRNLVTKCENIKFKNLTDAQLEDILKIANKV